MKWYLILLAVVGGLALLLILFLIIKKATKQKFTHAKKYLEMQPKVVKVEEEKKEEVTSPIGLNLNGLYSDNEETYDQQEDDETIRGFDYDQFEPPKLQKPKNLLEQIRELSPELKMLIFDRGLARKDYDFKSKKD